MPIQVFLKTMASGSDSCTFDFGGQHYTKAYLWHSTMSTAAELHVYGSWDGSNFYRVYNAPYNTATTGLMGFIVSSGLTQALVEVPLPTPYVKIIATAAAADGVDVRIIAHSDY